MHPHGLLAVVSTTLINTTLKGFGRDGAKTRDDMLGDSHPKRAGALVGQVFNSAVLPKGCNEWIDRITNDLLTILTSLSTSFCPPCPVRYFLLDTASWYSEHAYALVNPICFSNFVIAHEFGHNLGCDHNREHAADDQDYAHGYRYCSGTDM